jgi:heptosyltransferase-2
LLVSSRACVGNDTGVLNIALASGTTTFGLFGGSPPLTHVASLHVIQAQDAHLAMAGITVQQVYDAIVREIGTTV